MTKRSHPVGLRLNISSVWNLHWDLFNNEAQAISFFLYRWLIGFCRQNYVYYFSAQIAQLTRYRLMFFFFFFKGRRRRKKTRWLRFQRSLYMSKSSRRRLMKKKKNIKRSAFFLKKSKQKILLGLWKSTRKKALSHRFRYRTFIKIGGKKTLGSRLPLFKNVKTRKMVSVKTKFRLRKQKRPLIIARLKLLRLKAFIEDRLSHLIKRNSVGLLVNFGELFLKIPPTYLAHKHHLFHRTVRRLNGRIVGLKRSISQLFFMSALVSRPVVIHQWLYYYLMKVKKHHVVYSHYTYLRIFSTLCESLVYYVGRLRGYRALIVGKVGGSDRSKTQIYQAGTVLTNHKLKIDFAYSFQHIPTFAGVLGCHLWFLYDFSRKTNLSKQKIQHRTLELVSSKTKRTS